MPTCRMEQLADELRLVGAETPGQTSRNVDEVRGLAARCAPDRESELHVVGDGTAAA